MTDSIFLFGLVAPCVYGRTFEVRVGQVTYRAHDEDGWWSVYILDRHGSVCAIDRELVVAEARAEAALRGSGRLRCETADAIAARRAA